MSIRLLTSALLLSLIATIAAVAQEPYDVVISGGRVMDPETGRDEIANIGIIGNLVPHEIATRYRRRANALVRHTNSGTGPALDRRRGQHDRRNYDESYTCECQSFTARIRRCELRVLTRCIGDCQSNYPF